MFAYFGTDVDRRKGTIRVNVDQVEGITTEGSDKKWSMGFLKVCGLSDGIEEVGIDKFFLGIPDMAILLVGDCILIGMVVSGSKARWGSKEVIKRDSVDSGNEDSKRVASR